MLDLWIGLICFGLADLMWGVLYSCLLTDLVLECCNCVLSV